jgi:hypothetical protein
MSKASSPESAISVVRPGAVLKTHKGGAKVRLPQAAFIGRAAGIRQSLHSSGVENESQISHYCCSHAGYRSRICDDTYPYVDHSRFTGSKDRAEVEAELASAGPVTSRLHEFVDYTRVTSGKARGEFRAELERAYAGSNYASTRMSEYIDFSQAARTASAAAAVADLIPIPRLAEPRDVPGV